MPENGMTPVPLQLPPEEPNFGPWRIAPVHDLIGQLEPDLSNPSSLKIVAVDGRSAGGKSTLAAVLSQALPDSVVVHTDDIAWHHSFFDWTELLLEHVLKPARAGASVAYRPPAWNERNRPGAVTVPEGCEVLILEGVGAARRELTPELDATLWVQSDFAEARRRGIARDGGDAEAARFWDEWMAAELPFLADQRPWERADAVVLGTPSVEYHAASQVVLATLGS